MVALTARRIRNLNLLDDAHAVLRRAVEKAPLVCGYTVFRAVASQIDHADLATVSRLIQQEIDQAFAGITTENCEEILRINPYEIAGRIVEQLKS